MGSKAKATAKNCAIQARGLSVAEDDAWTQDVLMQDLVPMSMYESTLRAMDALHVACALAIKPDVFVSADHRQLSAARKAGLKIVDVSK